MGDVLCYVFILGCFTAVHTAPWYVISSNQRVVNEYTMREKVKEKRKSQEKIISLSDSPPL